MKLEKIRLCLLLLSMLMAVSGMPGAIAEAIPTEVGNELPLLELPALRTWIRTAEWEIGFAAELPEGTRIVPTTVADGVGLDFIVGSDETSAAAFSLLLNCETGDTVRVADDGHGKETLVALALNTNETDDAAIMTLQTFADDVIDSVQLYRIPEQTGESTLEQLNVVAAEFELKYNGRLLEVLTATALKDTAEDDICLKVRLSDRTAELFTIIFNSYEGDMVVELVNSSGTRVPVAFRMAVAPEGIGAEDLDTFYAAQELVNEAPAWLTMK